MSHSLITDQEALLAKARKPGEEALRLASLFQGKVQILPKCPIRSFEDFAIWYSPGVAALCQSIQASPGLVYDFTNKGNTIAIVSDGSRVLGLGNIGPEAGLPVMEGKALLFKYLGGVDAVPLCLKTESDDDFIRAVKSLEPTFGGINLEDISQPRCFAILDRLRREMNIPVWHDDQQGTATVIVAGLLNALLLVGKSLDNIRIAMIGMGAANVANYRLLKAAGVNPGRIVACDSQGILNRGRQDIEKRQSQFMDKWTVCCESNADERCGGIAEALRGADVCLALSRSDPGLIRSSWLQQMNTDAIVFACANPVPEIWPWDAKQAGARIVATGRGDFPNQINNSLGFPGIFRGALDVRARTITDDMALAAAWELAGFARQRGLNEDSIVPRMDEVEVFPRVAAATALKAQEQKLEARSATREQLLAGASQRIRQAQEATRVLMKEKLIPSI